MEIKSRKPQLEFSLEGCTYLLTFPTKLCKPTIHALTQNKLQDATASNYIATNLSIVEQTPLLAKQSRKDKTEILESIYFLGKKLGLTKQDLNTASHKLNWANQVRVGLIKSIVNSGPGVVVSGGELSTELIYNVKWFCEYAKQVCVYVSDELDRITEFDSFILVEKDGLSYQGSGEEFLKRYAKQVLIEIQFTEPAQSLQSYGTVIKQTDWVATLKVDREHKEQLSAKIIQEQPVKTLTMRELPIAEIMEIRNKL